MTPKMLEVQNERNTRRWLQRGVRRMAHIWWTLLQWNHQSYSAMKAAPHQSAPSSVAPNKASGQSWLLVAHLYEMNLSPERDNEPNCSCKLLTPEPNPNLENESSQASPSVWRRAEDAYLESRLRILRASILAPIPRTRRRNRKSSPIARVARRRIYAGARLCWKTIRSIGRRLCQLKSSSLRVIWRANSPCTNPPNDPKLSHGAKNRKREFVCDRQRQAQPPLAPARC